ncbi:MAG: cell division protein FtsZ [Aquisalimonadaceae bacterium]
MITDEYHRRASIKVIGVGGGGCNAVGHMIAAGVTSVDFICVDTDAQALTNTTISETLALGAQTTKRRGAGGNPAVGREAALQNSADISEILAGTDIVFIVASMGGGTGTGAAPVLAEIARTMGILTVGVVTKPFPFEGSKRMRVAMEGIETLTRTVDSLITIPNEKLLSGFGQNLAMQEAFQLVNNVLLDAVRGIAELIAQPGLINVDLTDLRTVMSNKGLVYFGTGSASGVNRAREAAERAISYPLLEGIDLADAQGLLINITADMNLTIGEFDNVGQVIRKCASENASVIAGTVIDRSLNDEVRVTLVATGIGFAQSNRKTRTFDLDHAAEPNFTNVFGETINLVVPNELDDETTALLIELLSKAYRGVGGDSLAINETYPLPPLNEEDKKAPSSAMRLRNG